MDYIEDCSDERLKGMCAQCGVWIGGENNSADHVPSKCLLSKSEGQSNDEYPANLPVIQTCLDCNKRTSKDEEYLWLFLHCVLAGSTEPEDHTAPNVRRALKRHVGLREQIECSKRLVSFGGDEIPIWAPELSQVNRVVLKNARGHAYYECGEPVLTKPEHVFAMPLMVMTEVERTRFEKGREFFRLWPEMGSRMMIRLVTGQGMRNGWVVVQDGVYRYRVEQGDGLLIKTVLHEYLGTEVYWSHTY